MILQKKQSLTTLPTFEIPSKDNIEEFEGKISYDVCNNINEIQLFVPEGYELGTNGDCTELPVDICKNVDGVQNSLYGYELEDNGDCISLSLDVCPNLDKVQIALPAKYKLEGGNCVFDLLKLEITELLPNATGDDGGSEFIEIYNPNNVEVCLSDYLLSIGTNNTKYSFPTGNCIGAGEYVSFYNNVIKFTLLNTTSVVRLLGTDGILVDESLAYNDPDDGVAWALIDDIWQYTNQPTPGGANLPSLVASNASITTVPTSILKPCKDGQYRSEETNRCRSIASDVNILVPCAEGEERNPDTNRCRSITAVLGASDLAPCKTGQERNPDTNRCRNIVSTIPKADYAPKQTASNSNNYIIWLSLAVVGMVAVGYGVWEWRQEINNGRLKLLSFLKHRK